MKARRFFTKSEWGLLVLTAIFLCLLVTAARAGDHRGSWDYRILSSASRTDVTPEEAPPVNLNAADAEELDTLPGIGPVLAERIIAWREEFGPFTEIGQLLEVSGIGEATLTDLQGLVTVEESQTQEEPE